MVVDQIRIETECILYSLPAETELAVVTRDLWRCGADNQKPEAFLEGTSAPRRTRGKQKAVYTGLSFDFLGPAEKLCPRLWLLSRDTSLFQEAATVVQLHNVQHRRHSVYLAVIAGYHGLADVEQLRIAVPSLELFRDRSQITGSDHIRGIRTMGRINDVRRIACSKFRQKLG